MGFLAQWLLDRWKHPGSLSLVGLLTLYILLGRIGHPPLFMDEAFVLRGAAHLISERSLNPPWHEWPPMAAYAAVPAVGLAAGWGSLQTGLSPRDWAALAAGFHDTALVWPLRALAAMALVISAWAVGKLAQRISGSFTCGRAAFLVMVLGSPVLLQYATWGLPDLPMLACGTMALLLTRASSRHLRPDVRAVLAGLFVGMATAWKFHGGLMLFSVLGLLLLRSDMPLWPTVRRCVLASALAFVTFAPTFLFAPADAWGGLHWLIGNLARDRYAPVEQTAALAPPSLTQSLNEAVALPVLGLALGLGLLGLGRKPLGGISRHSATMAALLLTPIVTGVLVAFSQRRDGNYLLPAIPGLVVAIVWAAHTGVYTSRRFLPAKTWRWLLLPLPLLALVTNHHLLFLRWEEPRSQMARLIRERQDPQMEILRVGGYTPKIWCPAEIEEFFQGPGRSLSESGRKEFARRLAAAPKARLSTTLSERATTPAEVLRHLNPGTYIVSTRILRDRTQGLPAGGDGWKDFFDRLETDQTYELLAETQSQSPEDQKLYRVRSTTTTAIIESVGRP